MLGMVDVELIKKMRERGRDPARASEVDFRD